MPYTMTRDSACGSTGAAAGFVVVAVAVGGVGAGWWDAGGAVGKTGGKIPGSVGNAVGSKVGSGKGILIVNGVIAISICGGTTGFVAVAGGVGCRVVTGGGVTWGGGETSGASIVGVLERAPDGS